MISFPRLHLFELEDQGWFPAIIRDFATDYLSFIQSAFGLEQPVRPVLSEALRITGVRQMVDLCSGAGGPMLSVHKGLAKAGLKTRVMLTDKFPNLDAFARLECQSHGQLSFVHHSIDARFVPDELRGFRTIFNSFHHFGEADAKQILRNAAEARQPIAIFEYPERSALIILLTTLLTPWLVALFTLFIRPFRWSRIFFTCLVPLIPLTCWWDGVVSNLRAYTVEELTTLTKDLCAGAYDWRAGTIPVSYSPAHLTYLVGYPR